LVVDDSATVRAVIRKTLELSGIELGEFLEAANGKEGLETLRKSWVDLVFCDINMPVMNGEEMIRAMREDEELRSIPVVVVSTEASSTRIESLHRLGVQDYIKKPFTPEMLRNVVKTLLGGQG
ncbi:MAG TPA: response regulator, partial [Candidatus Hydrogenedentes bacterium]|nr:response regulator [Candidatus Hydrogenedentota bacterium]